MFEQTLSRIQRRNTTRNELQTAYSRLNDFIETLNIKITGRIQLVQQVYLEDYKNQVKQMTEELKSIRSVLDEELLRQRANERLFFLEEQRDFFRGQVIKLNEELTTLTKNNGLLMEELEESKAEAANYKNLVYGLQKKIVKIQNQIFETERLKKASSTASVKIPAIQQKQMASTLQTKPTLTKFQSRDSVLGRRMYQSIELKREYSQSTLDNQVKRKDEILQECIKDLKKKIFYRTLSERNNAQAFFQEHKQIAFEKFTRTDKEELIKTILSDASLLEQFYTFMTNKKQPRDSVEMRVSQNNSHRISLNDKIFKLKLCGTSRELK